MKCFQKREAGVWVGLAMLKKGFMHRIPQEPLELGAWSREMLHDHSQIQCGASLKVVPLNLTNLFPGDRFPLLCTNNWLCVDGNHS